MRDKSTQHFEHQLRFWLNMRPFNSIDLRTCALCLWPVVSLRSLRTSLCVCFEYVSVCLLSQEAHTHRRPAAEHCTHAARVLATWRAAFLITSMAYLRAIRNIPEMCAYDDDRSSLAHCATHYTWINIIHSQSNMSLFIPITRKHPVGVFWLCYGKEPIYTFTRAHNERNNLTANSGSAFHCRMRKKFGAIAINGNAALCMYVSVCSVSPLRCETVTQMFTWINDESFRWENARKYTDGGKKRNVMFVI